MILLSTVKKIKDAYGWVSFAAHFIGVVGLGGIASGLIATIVGVAGAFITGLPWPFTVMGAFCTIVATLYLALFPKMFKILYGVQKASITATTKQEINWAIWKQRAELTVAEFSSILAKDDPISSKMSDEARTFIKLLLEDMENKKLLFKIEYTQPLYSGTRIYPKKPTDTTLIKREAALDWAAAKNFDAKHIH